MQWGYTRPRNDTGHGPVKAAAPGGGRPPQNAARGRLIRLGGLGLVAVERLALADLAVAHPPAQHQQAGILPRREGEGAVGRGPHAGRLLRGDRCAGSPRLARRSPPVPRQPPATTRGREALWRELEPQPCPAETGQVIRLLPRALARRSGDRRRLLDQQLAAVRAVQVQRHRSILSLPATLARALRGCVPTSIEIIGGSGGRRPSRAPAEWRSARPACRAEAWRWALATAWRP